MTKRTATSIHRHFVMNSAGKLVRRIHIIPAKPLVEMICRCGRKHLVSEGQNKKCYHGGKYEKSRRKRNQKCTITPKK